MIWRGAVFSGILHVGLLVGVVGGLPILPSIFDRSVETSSNDLPILVELVSEATLREISDIAGLQNAAPDAEIAQPLPGRTIALLTPEPATRVPSPNATQPTPVTRKPRNPDVPSTIAPKRPPASTVMVVTVPPDVLPAPLLPPPLPPKKPEARNSPPNVPPPIVKDASPPKTKQATTADTVKERALKESAGATESEFIRSVSGRKRNLVVELLESDPRLRRAVTPVAENTDIPEEARRRTLDRLARSAQAGFSHAQYNLAGRYLRGQGLPKDLETAQKWLTRAAEQGYAPAQSVLALMRLTGQGVEQDQAEAAFWWHLAAEAGNAGAAQASKNLRPLLKPQEYVRSQRLRARWGSLIADLADRATGDTSRREIDRALQEAAEKGDLDSVLSLLARGADADLSGDAGRNAVINAAWRGHQRIIQLLLERGVETELPDEDGRTPLIWAAINGHKDVVADLVTGGANPNMRDRNGGTALIRAAWNGHESVTSRLIDAGADINARDDKGLTALAHARREGNTAVIRMLLAAGAR